mmetsp:Transcript_21418/g.67238  ORF Transcript_21418/g.67238 Transcript_21418/m.67238 type:complete len:305 (+) Transcript_21418:2908-3822(+)
MAATCQTSGSVGTTKRTRPELTHVYVEITVFPDEVGAHTIADFRWSTWCRTRFCHASSFHPLRNGDSGGSRSYIFSSWNAASPEPRPFRASRAARSSFRNSCSCAASGLRAAPLFPPPLPPPPFFPPAFFFSSSCSSPSASAEAYSGVASIAHSTSSTAAMFCSFSSASSTRSSCRSRPSWVSHLVASTVAPTADRDRHALTAFSNFSRSSFTSFASWSFLFRSIISSFFVGFFAPPFFPFCFPACFASASAAAAASLASSARFFSFAHISRGSNAVSGARLRSTTGIRLFTSRVAASRRFFRT